MEIEPANLAALFLSSVASSTVLPGTSEALFAVLLVKGEPVLPALVIATLGNWIGGMTTYALGRAGNWRWLGRFGVEETAIRRFQGRIERWGSFLGVLAWLPVIGDVIVAALGFLRLSWTRVAVYTLLGRFLRYALLAFGIAQLNG